MTQSKNTKKALLMSMLSILLCVAMLIGSTFAWFTDNVTSGRNKIVAGNLDIELYRGVTTDDSAKVTKDTMLFQNPDGTNITWEPGVVIYENFTVKNVGSLALKYSLALNVVDKNFVKDTTKSLADVIKVAFLNKHFTGDRTEAEALTDYKPLENTAKTGTLLPEEKDADRASEQFAIVLYWEPGEHDNDYNLNNGKESSNGEPLFITLGVDLNASQYTYEKDSFNELYDENAPLHEWDGVTADITWFNPDTASETDNYTLATSEALAGLQSLVEKGNDFSEKTITLENGIYDFGGEEWEPVGTNTATFNGSFDGNGSTIQNLQLTTADSDYVGFFGKVGENSDIKNVTLRDCTVEANEKNYVGALAGLVSHGSIKDVTVESCTVHGNEHVGGLVGNGFVENFEGCTVKNCDISGGKMTGGIVGDGYGSLKDLTVENCNITNNYTKVGGIVGQIHELNGNPVFENLTVTKTAVNITPDMELTEVGGIVGYCYQNSSYTFKNCTVTDFTVTSGKTINKAGGIIGQIHNNLNGAVSTVLDGCSVNGLTLVSNAASNGVIGPSGGLIGASYYSHSNGAVAVVIRNCSVDIKKLSIEHPRTTGYNGAIYRVGIFIGEAAGYSYNNGNTITCEGTNTYKDYYTQYGIDESKMPGNISLWGYLGEEEPVVIEGEDTLIKAEG